MDNYQVSDALNLLANLLDIHGENSFKSKSYSTAAYSVEKIPTPLSEIPKEKLASLKGIGTSSAQKIIEFLETGTIHTLEELIKKTPTGVLEMLKIKGIGPKKINTIWKEMEIESIGELLYACKENRLKLYKGFGEKTQQNVIASIEFYQKNIGRFLYAHAESFLSEILNTLQQQFIQIRIEVVGDVKRQVEIIQHLAFVLETDNTTIEETLSTSDFFQLQQKKEDILIYQTVFGIDIHLMSASKATFIQKVVQHSSSSEFWEHISPLLNQLGKSVKDEIDFFVQMGLPFIPACLRDDHHVIEKYPIIKDQIIKTENIKGIIHCHSNWSDGNNTIEEISIAAAALGMEYLVLSDHSKSAFYAQGLSIEKVIAQHEHINELNRTNTHFKIFKSIESDILNDGSLDYPDEILEQFDLIIASIHSNLKMNEEKAMSRLIKAIENPYTTILGHMTGRLLLSRPGYPVNYRKIIDACAQNNVAIELNANPNRLDIDWRQIDYALNKNVLISINPDAHQLEGLKDIRYGVLVAQKAMVQSSQNLSSFELPAFETFLTSRK